jgi:hypothetical protein
VGSGQWAVGSKQQPIVVLGIGVGIGIVVGPPKAPGEPTRKFIGIAGGFFYDA